MSALQVAGSGVQLATEVQGLLVLPATAAEGAPAPRRALSAPLRLLCAGIISGLYAVNRPASRQVTA